MKYVSVSGTVAAGKSTLLDRLLARLGDRADAHIERPENNPFIREYYADAKRWSFHSQMTFLALYFDDDWLRADRDFYFYDRCLIENLVIARYRFDMGDLTRTEFDLVEKMARGIERLMPPVDKYLYLRCSEALLLARLRERSRDYESGLNTDYIRRQKALYDAWADTLPRDRLLVIDEDAGVDLEAVLRFIERD